MMDYLDYQYNQDIKCPYCDHDFTDSWEYQDDGELINCESCGKYFWINVHHETTYSSKKTDCANDLAPHNWKPIIGAPREYFDNKERCEGCGEERVRPTLPTAETETTG